MSYFRFPQTFALNICLTVYHLSFNSVLTSSLFRTVCACAHVFMAMYIFLPHDASELFNVVLQTLQKFATPPHACVALVLQG